MRVGSLRSDFDPSAVDLDSWHLVYTAPSGHYYHLPLCHSLRISLRSCPHLDTLASARQPQSATLSLLPNTSSISHYRSTPSCSPPIVASPSRRLQHQVSRHLQSLRSSLRPFSSPASSPSASSVSTSPSSASPCLPRPSPQAANRSSTRSTTPQ